jgi:hypothetical protein
MIRLPVKNYHYLYAAGETGLQHKTTQGHPGKD